MHFGGTSFAGYNPAVGVPPSGGHLKRGFSGGRKGNTSFDLAANDWPCAARAGKRRLRPCSSICWPVFGPHAPPTPLGDQHHAGPRSKGLTIALLPPSALWE